MKIQKTLFAPRRRRCRPQTARAFVKQVGSVIASATTAKIGQSMSDELGDIPIYEVPADALRLPWVSRSLRALIAARRLRPRRRIVPAALAALTSLALHALLIGSVVWTASETPAVRRPQYQGPGSTEIVSPEEPTMTLVLINEPQPIQKMHLFHVDLASRGFAPPDLAVTLLSPNGEPAFDTSKRENTNAAAPSPASDMALRAMLYGRYVRQIKARVDRAWMRPRTPIGADSFNCRVQIIQDRHGNVKETTLQECNGDLRWQLSVVQAIQSASPLPAPPDPQVFANAFTLELSSMPYVPGGSREGFEPPERRQ